MINILIVDDDMATVEAIKTSVNWEKVNITEVNTAYDAMYAKKILEEKKIDIVISDIEMPKESGLDLLRWVRESGLDCEFLLLTCHENFNYAAKAIGYSAAAYLTKPFEISIMELNLQKITQRLLEKRNMKKTSEYGVWMEKNRKLLKLDFWKNLVEGTYPDKKNLQSEISERHMEIQLDHSYIIVYAKVSSMDMDIEKYTKNIFEFVLEGMFSEVLTEKVENEDVVKFHYEDTMSYVLIIPIEQQKEIYERCQKLMDTCRNYFKSTITMCISKEYELLEISEAFFNLKKKFDYNIANFGKIFYEEDSLSLEPGEMQILDIKILTQMLEEKDKGKILKYLKQIFDELSSLKKLNVHSLYLMKQEITQVFYAELSKQGILATKLFYDEFSEKLSSHAMDSKVDMIRWVNYMIEKTFAYEEEVSKSATIIDKIEVYIKNNYENDIGRNEIAAEFFLTPEYLAKLYKKKTGMNIKDYINEYRIEKAKELLKSDSKTISDIAAEVGFDNFSYFSTIFKKVTGISPKDYKNR